MRDLPNSEAKTQIAAAVTLAPSITDQTINAEEFCSRFGLSSPAIEAVRKAMPHESLMVEHFQFDSTEFRSHITFRSVELSNGGILTADASKFDEVFQQEPVGQDGEVRFITEGQIVDQRFRKARV